ncbi:MAG TPA: pyridoxamine 5'-phosphate oxidase family protein [Streptosporangiaceae bacterium]
MGQVYPELDERLMQFIRSQPMFFVATAPCLGADGSGGHVNVSPKGYRDTFVILGPRRVAYVDLTGSGAETIAHLRQNGQITLMFCSFDRTPKIVRIHGTGRVVLPADPDWPELISRFGAGPDGAGPDGAGRAITGGADLGDKRAVIVVTAGRISDSCGYAVPVMELTQERDLLTRWAERKTPAGLAAYRIERNKVSIDGLPAID